MCVAARVPVLVRAMPSPSPLSIVVAAMAIASAATQGSASPEKTKTRPEFLSMLPNETVALGRDVVLPCVVKNLQDYKVAFIHLDRQMIVAIHNHVITRIPRFEVSHDNHHTWNLHIRNVQKEDKGHYMCQINTDPMISTIGRLDVVVPPNILDAESSPSMVSVRENHNASLVCRASGTPQPDIKWQREDKKNIVLKGRKKEERVDVQGEVLELMRISRTEMGAYLCIASNKVPPSMSKRIILTVEFSPMIWVPNQLVGAPLGATVKLECHTESSPKAISYWAFADNMILHSDRFRTDERHHSEYKLDSTLTIRALQKEDFGTYRCIAKNSLGETEGTIRLYELEASTTSVQQHIVIEDITKHSLSPEMNQVAYDYIETEDVDAAVDVVPASTDKKPTRSYDRQVDKERRVDRDKAERTFWNKNGSARSISRTSLQILICYIGVLWLAA